MKNLTMTCRVGQTVELKVCEACGTLWLRKGTHGGYCGGCAQWLSEFPQPRGRRVRKTLRQMAMGRRSGLVAKAGSIGGAR